jgi:hypothetical protein
MLDFGFDKDNNKLCLALHHCLNTLFNNCMGLTRLTKMLVFLRGQNYHDQSVFTVLSLHVNILPGSAWNDILHGWMSFITYNAIFNIRLGFDELYHGLSVIQEFFLYENLVVDSALNDILYEWPSLLP